MELNKRNFMNIGELAMGVNPRARASPYLIEAEKIDRTPRIALGSGYEPDREMTYHRDDRSTHIKGLLKRYFDTDATGPYNGMKNSTAMRCPRTGKTFSTIKDFYYTYIRTHSLEAFHKDVEFTIERKQQ